VEMLNVYDVSVALMRVLIDVRMLANWSFIAASAIICVYECKLLQS